MKQLLKQIEQIIAIKILSIIIMITLIITFCNAGLTTLEAICISLIFGFAVVVLLIGVVEDYIQYKIIKAKHESWERFKGGMTHLTPEQQKAYNDALDEIFIKTDINLFDMDKEENKDE